MDERGEHYLSLLVIFACALLAADGFFDALRFRAFGSFIHGC